MSIYDDLKQALEVIQKGGNIELIKKVIDIQKQAMDLMEENIAIKEENKSLQESLKTKETMVLENGFYWMEIKNQNETKKEGPFCPGCWIKENNPIPLVFNPEKPYDSNRKCPGCEVKFVMEIYEESSGSYMADHNDQYSDLM